MECECKEAWAAQMEVSGEAAQVGEGGEASGSGVAPATTTTTAPAVCRPINHYERCSKFCNGVADPVDPCSGIERVSDCAVVSQYGEGYNGEQFQNISATCPITCKMCDQTTSTTTVTETTSTTTATTTTQTTVTETTTSCDFSGLTPDPIWCAAVLDEPELCSNPYEKPECSQSLAADNADRNGFSCVANHIYYGLCPVTCKQCQPCHIKEAALCQKLRDPELCSNEATKDYFLSNCPLLCNSCPDKTTTTTQSSTLTSTATVTDFTSPSTTDATVETTTPTSTATSTVIATCNGVVDPDYCVLQSGVKLTQFCGIVDQNGLVVHQKCPVLCGSCIQTTSTTTTTTATSTTATTTTVTATTTTTGTTTTQTSTSTSTSQVCNGEVDDVVICTGRTEADCADDFLGAILKTVPLRFLAGVCTHACWLATHTGLAYSWLLALPPGSGSLSLPLPLATHIF